MLCFPLGLVHTGERQSMSVHTIQITAKRECWLDAIWCELAHVQLLGTYVLWSRATASTLHNISSTAFETITFLLFSSSKCPKEWNSTSKSDRVTLGWVGGVFPPTFPFLFLNNNLIPRVLVLWPRTRQATHAHLFSLLVLCRIN